jgi:hypothetical protein
MSVRSLGRLAARRRSGVQPTGAAAALSPAGGDGGDGLASLEEAVPTEIIAFYTAILAACETVLARSPAAPFTAFRVAAYVTGVVATGVVSWVALRPVVHTWHRILGAPEWWTSVLAFAGWGAAVPGSFLYVWLRPNPLTIAVATITATAGLILTVVLTPKLRNKAPGVAGQAPPGGLTIVPINPP